MNKYSLSRNQFLCKLSRAQHVYDIDEDFHRSTRLTVSIVHTKESFRLNRFISKMVFDKLKFLKAHWSNREKYEKIAGVVDGTLSLLGCRVLSDGRINWWTYSSLIVVSIYWSLAIFTVCYHADHNQFGKALPSLCLLGISVSVCGIV